MTFCQTTNRVFERNTTGTAVVYLTDYILEHIDRKMITGAVFIDLKKAFDLVDHECLLFQIGRLQSQRK